MDVRVLIEAVSRYVRRRARRHAIQWLAELERRSVRTGRGGACGVRFVILDHQFRLPTERVANRCGTAWERGVRRSVKLPSAGLGEPPGGRKHPATALTTVGILHRG
jgi:hypothetical protein